MDRRLSIRPIRPDDEARLAAFHRALSDATVHARYFSALKLSTRIAHDRLSRICRSDPQQDFVLVAEAPGTVDAEPEIVAVGRLSRERGRNEAEIAILVADAWQRHGIGTELVRRLVAIGRTAGLDRIHADMLGSNPGMRRLAQAAGFRVAAVPGDPGVLRAELPLGAERVPA